LQLQLGHSLQFSVFPNIQQSLCGRRRGAPPPHLQVHGDGVHYGEGRVGLLAQDAGEDLRVVEVAGERALPKGRPEVGQSRKITKIQFISKMKVCCILRKCIQKIILKIYILLYKKDK
jgi:hypothetical protein